MAEPDPTKPEGDPAPDPTEPPDHVEDPTPTEPPKPSATAKPDDIVIPRSSFKARIEREAAMIVKRRLGVTVEEAETLVKKARSPDPADDPKNAQATADVAIAKLRDELADLRKQNEEKDRQFAEQAAKHRRDMQRAKDEKIEAELRVLAVNAGVTDPKKATYALHLFKEAAVEGKVKDPAAYFAELRKEHDYLFAPAPKPTAENPAPPASTAPPESKAPGEVTPKPAAAGAPPAKDDVSELDHQAFAARTRAAYGYSPSL